MSVCIAVLCEKGNAIVCVTDRKIDFVDFSADRIGEKSDVLNWDSLVLYSGNDAEYAGSILQVVRQKLGDDMGLNPQALAECVQETYHEYLQKEITNKVLRRWGFTQESFRKQGRRQLTPEVFTALCNQITQVKISLQFLVCGFEKVAPTIYRGHIYFVPGIGAITSRDDIGMWAIGAGKHLALSSLAFAADKRKFSKNARLGEAVYTALEAKFMAESHSLVGRMTNVMIIRPNQYLLMEDRYIEEIKSEWAHSGAPRIPNRITKEIPTMLFGVRFHTKGTRMRKHERRITSPLDLKMKAAKEEKS